jgi:hypothetical protein
LDKFKIELAIQLSQDPVLSDALTKHGEEVVRKQQELDALQQSFVVISESDIEQLNEPSLPKFIVDITEQKNSLETRYTGQWSDLGIGRIPTQEKIGAASTLVDVLSNPEMDLKDLRDLDDERALKYYTLGNIVKKHLERFDVSNFSELADKLGEESTVGLSSPRISSPK